MIIPTAVRLEYLCNTIPALLANVDEDAFSLKPSDNKWSKKEILGHLIDSAANNHHRFVRSQFEDEPAIFYDPNEWVTHNSYQQMPLKQLVDFWAAYNLQMAALVKLLPPARLQRLCTMKDGTKLTVEFLIEDYVIHLEHHLQQIVTYDGFASKETGKPF